jgi:hypothetical protein
MPNSVSDQYRPLMIAPGAPTPFGSQVERYRRSSLYELLPGSFDWTRQPLPFHSAYKALYI